MVCYTKKQDEHIGESNICFDEISSENVTKIAQLQHTLHWNMKTLCISSLITS
jgi:hypothetical protein